MRRSGTIIKWNDEKGFGFIAPEDRTDDVFLHRGALVEKARRPQVSDRVFYELESKAGNRPRATRVVVRPPVITAPASPVLPVRPIATPLPPVWTPPRLRPTGPPARTSSLRRVGPRRLVLILSLPVLVLGAGYEAASRGYIPKWVAFLYVGMSAVAAIAYALDKFRAQKGKWRISESALQLFAMAGGWPGAFAAQRILRHKTSKLSFQVTYWIIVVAHLAFWSWFAATQYGWLPR